MSDRSFEDLHLELAWTDHAVNVERFGQAGSTPVRGFAPCAGIVDTAAGLHVGRSIGMGGFVAVVSLRARRPRSRSRAAWRTGTSATGAGSLAPGESFTAPRAGSTVVRGDFDAGPHRGLVGMQEPTAGDTTWGGSLTLAGP